MKFLVAGDVHSDLRAIERLAEKAEKENVDAIVLSGDFTNFDYLSKGSFKKLKQAGKKIFIIPGNHESLSTIKFAIENYGVFSLNGYYADFGEVGLFGAGGANIGPVTMNAEKEMLSMLSKSFDKIKKKKSKIMITHVHPSKSLVEKISGFEGSKAVKEAIDKFKPDVAIFSHIHEGHGIEDKVGDTRLICAGKDGVIVEV